MENKDLISIQVPIYNVSKYVDKCLKSIQNQTYDNFEVLMILDHADDYADLEIAKKYADSDKRFKLIVPHFEKQGITITRNYCLSLATGKYMTYIDGDDSVSPVYLENLHNAIIKDDADLAICSYKRSKYNIKLDKTIAKKIKKFDKQEILCRLFSSNKIGGFLWNKLYRTEIAKQIEFNPEYKLGHDLFWCFEYISKCEKINLIDKKLYHYLIRPGSEVTAKGVSKWLTFLNAMNEVIERTDKDEKVLACAKTWRGVLTVLAYFRTKKMLPQKKILRNILASYIKEGKIALKHNKYITWYHKLYLKYAYHASKGDLL